MSSRCHLTSNTTRKYTQGIDVWEAWLRRAPYTDYDHLRTEQETYGGSRGLTVVLLRDTPTHQPPTLN